MIQYGILYILIIKEKIMKSKPLPSLKHLQECFGYNPETGVLFWKFRPLHHFIDEHSWKVWNARYANNIVSCISSNGYGRVSVDSNRYLVHRIIWKLVTGNDPIKLIDHIDGNRLNNRVSNLREANDSENQWNSLAQKNNKLGIKGVRLDKNGKNYCARITHYGKEYGLGTYDTIEEASLAYQKASLKYHGEFGNF
jgi:hypothetical protein